MGADFLLAGIRIKKLKPNYYNLLRRGIRNLTDKQLDDIEIYNADDENENNKLKRSRLLGLIDDLQEVNLLDGCRRDTAQIKLPNEEYLLVTGGLSWGDDPTDAYSMLQTLTELPERVLNAAGLSRYNYDHADKDD
jgi:hypothetical protein